jgi:hypothetical protein
LQQLVKTGTFLNAGGEEIKIHSAIDPVKGQLLQKAIQSINAEVAVEVGCAFGISSLYISDALIKTPNSRHHIIDPYQNDDLPAGWGGYGLYNLWQAGFGNIISHHNKLSH